MAHFSETSRSIVLRLKVFEGHLERNVAKFGSMNTFIEASWSNEKWYSKVSGGSHCSPDWNEVHVFESIDPAPLIFKVYHKGLFFSHQEIGFSIISVEDLFKGKINEWIDIYYEGKVSGKIKISVSMYEERRSEQSTHNTSYATVDLKEEYLRKCNELELEKEELEFYKRKYKKKVEKLNQEKRNYKNKVAEFVKKTTPKHTEESSDDENDYFPGISAQNEDCRTYEESLMREKSMLSQEKEALNQLNNQVVFDLGRLKQEKTKMLIKKKMPTRSQGKLSDVSKHWNINLTLDPSQAISKKNTSLFSPESIEDWDEIEQIKKQCLQPMPTEGNNDLLELRFGNSNQFALPRRAATPKNTEIERSNLKLRANNFSDGKLGFDD